MIWSASRSGSTWTYNHEKGLSLSGAVNPLERCGAFVVLTKAGTLRLIYQGPNNQYSEKIHELEPQSLVLESALTHAAFAPSKGIDICYVLILCLILCRRKYVPRDL